MIFKRVWKLLSVSMLMVGSTITIFADVIENPCGGPLALLALINRPTNINSACVVPYKEILLESGFQYQWLQTQGNQQNLPEAELRIGLPADNELSIVLPNYIHQSVFPQSGYTATTMGIKHEFGSTQHWLTAAETIFILPSGSDDFGSKGLGAVVNGIINYAFNSQFTVISMLGISTETAPSNSGGQRFNSFNPDLVLSWTIKQRIELYGEIYGKTKTSPDQGSGFNMDTGMIYLLLPNLTVDLSIGQRLNGNLGGFDHYMGTGFAVLF